MDKFWSIFLSILFIIALTILPFVFSFYLTVFDSVSYKEKFELYGVDKTFPEVDIEEYNKKVLNYLISKGEEMPTEIPLNERELSHMEDVKIAFQLLRTVLILCTLSCMMLYIFLIGKMPFAKIFMIAGLVSAGIALIAAGFFAASFQTSFDFFHTFFFQENSWQFYESDNLIKIYPENFFLGIALQIFTLDIIISLIVCCAGYVSKKIYKLAL